jgi:phage gp36-like protein
MNKFLKQNDFAKAIKADQLTSIIGINTTIQDDAVRASQIEIESYLRGKYNLTLLFAIVPDFVLSNAHVHGVVVYDPTGFKWYAATATDVTTIPANTPLTDPQWVETTDPRDALIVEFMVDLALYRVHSRLAPNQIPEHRIVRRDDAISFLKSVAKYDITVGWDQDDATPPASINWGSNTKEIKIY